MNICSFFDSQLKLGLHSHVAVILSRNETLKKNLLLASCDDSLQSTLSNSAIKIVKSLGHVFTEADSKDLQVLHFIISYYFPMLTRSRRPNNPNWKISGAWVRPYGKLIQLQILEFSSMTGRITGKFIQVWMSFLAKRSSSWPQIRNFDKTDEFSRTCQ